MDCLPRRHVKIPLRKKQIKCIYIVNAIGRWVHIMHFIVAETRRCVIIR